MFKKSNETPSEMAIVDTDSSQEILPVPSAKNRERRISTIVENVGEYSDDTDSVSGSEDDSDTRSSCRSSSGNDGNTSSGDDDDDDDDDEAIDDISDGENDDSDDILQDEDEDETDRMLSNKRRKKQVTTSRKKSPRKAKSSTPKSQSRSPKKNLEKNGDKMSVQYMTSVLSPMKKGFKIKNDSKPKLALLSPSKPTKSKLRIDITSQAFTEIKAKLHTSARISSLPGREDEFLTIYAALEQTIQDEMGTCLYVSGTPGVGKTATIREVIAQLQESVRDNQIREFEYLEINGLKLLSPNVAYEKLWEKISGFKVSASNAAILLENYFKDPKQVKKPLVVLVDELDQIVTKKQNVMYNFFNWPTYEQSKFIVIAVANTMDLPERVLTNKISSRLGLNRIQFIGYGFDQLGTIIRHRLDMLTKENQRKVVINKDAIGFASRKVASVSGDARRALTICRRAVEIAERDFMNNRDECNETQDETFHVQITHISQAISETINSPLQQFLKSLPFASKLVLAATLLRNKRSGLAENALGDIIDEMKNSLQMLTSKESNSAFAEIDSDSNIMQMLYSNQFLHKSDDGLSIRLCKFNQILNELTEFGVLVQQNVPGQRYKLIQLNVSAEEVNTAFARDNEVGDLLRNITK
jgi:origin recognition complex subunit 1